MRAAAQVRPAPHNRHRLHVEGAAVARLEPDTVSHRVEAAEGAKEDGVPRPDAFAGGVASAQVGP